MYTFRLNKREMRALRGDSLESVTNEGESHSGVHELSYGQVVVEYGEDVAESLLEYIRSTRINS
ncbi:MAG: hypothetical protein CL886_06305 [Dehalococcoidia bacterium]|nr:hypothetical protein [Dehalococcoidia bacterium]